MFNIAGELIFISEITHHNENFFTSFLVIDFTDKNGYEQQLKFEVKNKMCDAIQQFQIGQQVRVFFNLKGKGSHGVFYTNLEAWQVLLSGESKKEPPEQAPISVRPDPFEIPPPEEFVEECLDIDWQDEIPF